MPAHGLSVIVPCHNEAGGIGPVLEKLLEVLETIERPCEVIVVDDGSTDGTAKAVDTAHCRLLRLDENRGYGGALKAGAREARYDLVAIIDADGTYPAEALPRMLELLEMPGAEADMVVGARRGANVAIPLIRKPAKWALTSLANYLARRRIPDLNSGLRIVRKPLWDRYERFYPDGFSLTTTITLAALTNGWRVKYHDIDYHHRVGASKIRPIRDTVGFTQLILRTVLYFDPLKVFVPAALALFALSVLVGAGSWALAKWMGIGQFMDVSTVVLFVAAVQMLAIGALADLITKRLE
jgi:glycosyltransferase involved in cell wall biosynthesis